MKYLICLLFAALAVPAFAQTQQEVNAAILEELRALRKAQEETVEALARIEERLEEMDLQEHADISHWMPQKPDFEKLEKIELPENPTEEQAKAYIKEIMKASKGQNWFGPDDPQSEMLARVGRENLPALIAAHRTSRDHQDYLVRAIEMVAEEEDKELILKALPAAHDLIGLVVRFDWTQDARKTLLDELKGPPNYMPTEWIDAVASFKDPETYQLLIDFFLLGGNPSSTYDSIKNLPGLDLTDQVAARWSMIQDSRDEWEKRSMLPIALENGQAGAILSALEFIEDPKYQQWGDPRDNPRAVLMRYTPMRGTVDEMRKWYDENKDKLVFDKEKKRFVVQEGDEK